jgi:hypothetical protein
MACFDRNYEHRGDAEWLYDVPPLDECEFTLGNSARDALEAALGRAFHMRVLKEIAQLVQNYPTLPLILTEKKVSIARLAPDGFPISVETDRGRYMVRLGEWSDEFALADEVVDLLEAALRGEIRLRVDINAYGKHWAAERRLPNGEWITLPHHEDTVIPGTERAPIRTLFLRNISVMA